MAVTFKLEELLQARTSEDKAGKELTTQKSQKLAKLLKIP